MSQLATQIYVVELTLRENLVVIIGPVFLLSLEKGNHYNWEDLDEKAVEQTTL